jgi:hypothetical protein
VGYGNGEIVRYSETVMFWHPREMITGSRFEREFAFCCGDDLTSDKKRTPCCRIVTVMRPRQAQNPSAPSRTRCEAIARRLSSTQGRDAAGSRRAGGYCDRRQRRREHNRGRHGRAPNSPKTLNQKNSLHTHSLSKSKRMLSATELQPQRNWQLRTEEERLGN